MTSVSLVACVNDARSQCEVICFDYHIAGSCARLDLSHGSLHTVDVRYGGKGYGSEKTSK
ncbi:hypothetical protein FCULG_00012338 [Fusarium culmorum]|uniref:Uncharacterized protein n=1 Tax=Fusarium culmorum TaxID=5516 RepID=A0A2T4GRA1_FUSCU|nr:hypothetical protein FCULG_00012338 [Fusarium culmorum]